MLRQGSTCPGPKKREKAVFSPTDCTPLGRDMGFPTGLRERGLEGNRPSLQGTGLHLVGKVEKGCQEARGASCGLQPKGLALNRCWGQRGGTPVGGRDGGPVLCREEACLLRRGRGQTLEGFGGPNGTAEAEAGPAGIRDWAAEALTDPKGSWGPRLDSRDRG